MTDFAARISGVAMLALAALPFAALATAAHADTRVKVGDLDLLSRQGVAAYHQRVDAAGRKFCSEEKGLTRFAACREGVRIEMTERLDGLRQAQLAQTFAAR